MVRIFISYRRHDSASLAHLLAVTLQKYDIEAFLDTRNIDGGGPFPDRLRRAIEEADVFVCLLSETTLASAWVLEEIEHAHNLRKVMIPVFQERYVPPNPIPNAHVDALLQSDGVHVLDLRSMFVEESIANLAKMIQNSVKAPPKPKPKPKPIIFLGIPVFLVVFLLFATLMLVINQFGNVPSESSDDAVVLTLTSLAQAEINLEQTGTSLALTQVANVNASQNQFAQATRNAQALIEFNTTGTALVQAINQTETALNASRTPTYTPTIPSLDLTSTQIADEFNLSSTAVGIAIAERGCSLSIPQGVRIRVFRIDPVVE